MGRRPSHLAQTGTQLAWGSRTRHPWRRPARRRRRGARTQGRRRKSYRPSSCWTRDAVARTQPWHSRECSRGLSATARAPAAAAAPSSVRVGPAAGCATIGRFFQQNRLNYADTLAKHGRTMSQSKEISSAAALTFRPPAAQRTLARAACLPGCAAPVPVCRATLAPASDLARRSCVMQPCCEGLVHPLKPHTRAPCCQLSLMHYVFPQRLLQSISCKMYVRQRTGSTPQ